MAATKIDIWNMALTSAGAREVVSDVGTGEIHSLMNKWWPVLFEGMLESYDWAFARQIEALVEEVTPVLTDKWALEYVMPANAHVIRALITESSDEPQPFEVRLRSDATAKKVIFTDTADAFAVYTRLLDDSSGAEMALLSPSFIEALSYALQSKLATRLTQDKKTVQFAESLYAMAQSKAATATIEQRFLRGEKRPRTTLPAQIAGRL